mmetsp:Transcript_22929/g.56502  ORF Transcript_22929/g.56502 Transcript_22929/m.56502 type:complete len:200 (-) Transcript_22929:9-608(-)
MPRVSLRIFFCRLRTLRRLGFRLAFAASPPTSSVLLFSVDSPASSLFAAFSLCLSASSFNRCRSFFPSFFFLESGSSSNPSFFFDFDNDDSLLEIPVRPASSSPSSSSSSASRLSFVYSSSSSAASRFRDRLVPTFRSRLENSVDCAEDKVETLDPTPPRFPFPVVLDSLATKESFTFSSLSLALSPPKNLSNSENPAA